MFDERLMLENKSERKIEGFRFVSSFDEIESNRFFCQLRDRKTEKPEMGQKLVFVCFGFFFRSRPISFQNFGRNPFLVSSKLFQKEPGDFNFGHLYFLEIEHHFEFEVSFGFEGVNIDVDADVDDVDDVDRPLSEVWGSRNFLAIVVSPYRGSFSLS